MPTARIHGADLHYTVHGRGQPLLLLHGLGSSGRDWEYQIPAFAKHFQVIAPCLRGFGRSSTDVGPYTVSQFAADTTELLDQLGIEDTHILGFSMGGAIAFQMAVDTPQRLRRMVIVNSQPSFELNHWRKQLLVLMRIGMASVMGMERMTRFAAKRLFPLPEQADLRRRMQERHGANNKECYLATLRALAGWSVADEIGEILTPTLVIAAEHDLTPVEEKRAFAARMQAAELAVIKDSRHGTLFDRPDQCNELVLDYLRAEETVAA